MTTPEPNNFPSNNSSKNQGLLSNFPSNIIQTFRNNKNNCDICEETEAVLICEDCKIFHCEECDNYIHSRGKKKTHQKRTKLSQIEENVENNRLKKK